MNGEESSYAQFQRMQEQLPEALLITDAAETIRWANSAAAAITGWTTSELDGMSLADLISPEEVAEIARARGVGDPRALERYHCLLRTRSGEQREVSVAVGRAASAPPIYLVREIGRQRQIERRLLVQLSESQELETFGRVASLVAHDLRKFNNILSLLVSNFRRHHDDPAFRDEAIRTLQTVADQMSSLTETLSRSRTPAGSSRQRTTLGTLVEAVLDWLGSEQRGAVTSTVLNGLDRPLPCDVNVTDMQRVILNVLLNAYEAVPVGGQVHITGSLGPEEHQVQLTIEDTGPGIPRDYLDNFLFRPFRSSKPGGFGLGLYEAKLIVDAHGGTIEVANRPGETGTRVAIILPRANDEAQHLTQAGGQAA